MASLYEIEQVLSPRVLTGMYKELGDMIPANPLLEFYSAGMEDIPGDRFDFAYDAAVKEPAPGNKRNAPARVLQPHGLENKIAYMLRSFNVLQLEMETLHMLRDPNSELLQQKGAAEVKRQQEVMAARHKLFRAVCIAKALVDGIIYFNGTDQVLESSSGATWSFDLGVPASHKTQLTGVSSSYAGAIIGASWATAGTSILDHLTDLRIAAEEINAETPMHIWANPALLKNLRANTQVLSFITGGGSPEEANKILRGSIIEDLGGYTWHFYGGTYTAADGTTKPFIPTTKVIITPDLGPWLKAVQGSELVPNDIGLYPTSENALANVTEMFGQFAYAQLEHNPVRLSHFMGDNFNFIFTNPNAVFMPTVIF